VLNIAILNIIRKLNEKSEMPCNREILFNNNVIQYRYSMSKKNKIISACAITLFTFIIILLWTNACPLKISFGIDLPGRATVSNYINYSGADECYLMIISFFDKTEPDTVLEALIKSKWPYSIKGKPGIRLENSPEWWDMDYIEKIQEVYRIETTAPTGRNGKCGVHDTGWVWVDRTINRMYFQWGSFDICP
jgi:hypothetical protein